MPRCTGQQHEYDPFICCQVMTRRAHQAAHPMPPYAACSAGISSTPETSRSYSSRLGSAVIGQTNAQSMLDSSQSWIAGTNAMGERMQLDLGSDKAVVGTIVQPRAYRAQHVRRYTVQSSTDGISWTDSGAASWRSSGQLLLSVIAQKNLPGPVGPKFCRS